MYGKSFQSKYEGSMVGAGFHVYAVWDYCITKNRCGVIELNPKLLAFVLAGGGNEAERKVVEAIDFLTKPDPSSRSKDEEGRRLIQEGAFQYRMVNWAAYDGIKSIEALREYNRVKQAEYRAKKKMVVAKRSRGMKGEAAFIRSGESPGIVNEANGID